MIIKSCNRYKMLAALIGLNGIFVIDILNYSCVLSIFTSQMFNGHRVVNTKIKRHLRIKFIRSNSDRARFNSFRSSMAVGK